MKNILIVIGIILLGLLAGFFIKKFTAKSQPIDFNAQATTDFLKEVETQIAQLEERNSDLRIIEQTAYLGKDSLHNVNLHKMDSVLFFYFSQNTCSPCIDQTVSIIKETIDDYETNPRVIFISPDYPARFRENCYGKKLLILKKGELGIPLEKENVPFLFTLSDSLSINNLHIVNKSNFKRTEKYVAEIANNLNLN